MNKLTTTGNSNKLLFSHSIVLIIVCASVRIMTTVTHALELPLELLFMILWITWLILNNIFGWGQLNPKLSFNFLAGGWNGVAVDVLVEGVGGVEDSVVRGRGRLGVEKRVGVSFIRAEAATETMVVSMDSSSKSSMSNESTRETSFVASATVLKETSLLGVGAL